MLAVALPGHRVAVRTFGLELLDHPGPELLRRELAGTPCLCLDLRRLYGREAPESLGFLPMALSAALGRAVFRRSRIQRVRDLHRRRR